MKIKFFAFALLAGSLCFGLFIKVQAQESSVRFNDGITVAMKSIVTPSNSQSSPTSTATTSVTSGGKNVLHRIITDAQNKSYFGYDLIVSLASETGKYKISVEPLSIKPDKLISVGNLIARALPKYPNEMIVNDGDTISLEILENPQTKAEISDLIKVTAQDKKYYFTELLAAKDFTIDDVEMQFSKASVYVNDEKIVQSGSGAAGANLYFYLKDKGRFIFSLFPRAGFKLQKIGIAEGSQVSFVFGGDKYKLISSSSIVSTGGKWNLWVLHDPDYKPASEDRKSPFEVGSADKIEYLFQP